MKERENKPKRTEKISVSVGQVIDNRQKQGKYKTNKCTGIVKI